MDTPANPRLLLVLLKMTWGFLLLGIIGYLAHSFAMGNVEEKTSFGLPVLLGALVLLADRFAGWAFGDKSNSAQTPPKSGASD